MRTKHKQTLPQLSRANVTHYPRGRVFFKKRWPFPWSCWSCFWAAFPTPTPKVNDPGVKVKTDSAWAGDSDSNSDNGSSQTCPVRWDHLWASLSTLWWGEEDIPFSSLQDQATWLVWQCNGPLTKEVSKVRCRNEIPHEKTDCTQRHVSVWRLEDQEPLFVINVNPTKAKLKRYMFKCTTI